LPLVPLVPLVSWPAQAGFAGRSPHRRGFSRQPTAPKKRKRRAG
jgi:hypothetical protein